MSRSNFTEATQASWLQLLQENQTVRSVLQELAERSPQAFNPAKDSKIECVALKSAHAQGWHDCMQLLQDLAYKRLAEIESPFLDMSDDNPDK